MRSPHPVTTRHFRRMRPGGKAAHYTAPPWLGPGLGSNRAEYGPGLPDKRDGLGLLKTGFAGPCRALPGLAGPCRALPGLAGHYILSPISYFSPSPPCPPLSPTSIARRGRPRRLLGESRRPTLTGRPNRRQVRSRPVGPAGDWRHNGVSKDRGMRGRCVVRLQCTLRNSTGCMPAGGV